MSVKTPKPTQAQRYREGKPTAIGNGLELSEFKNCSIFNASTPHHFMAEAKEHLCDVIDGNFVTDQVLAKQTTPSVAEFIVWHLLIKLRSEFTEEFARNGQRDMWFSKGSPTDIDIIALREVEGIWRFYAIEIKWSHNCDYYGQVRDGLIADLNKLHRDDYSNHRLGTHITSLKTQLRRIMSREQIEEVFSQINAGTKPSETKGIFYCGYFVSDWDTDNVHHDPDYHFEKLTQAAKDNQWPDDTVTGCMLNIPDAERWLIKLAMGDC